MRFYFALCVLTLGLLTACGEDSNQPELPAKEVTFSSYKFTCVDATTKSPVTDTIRFSAVGGSYSYAISFRRERIESGVATGTYEYITPSSIQVEGGAGFHPQVVASNTEHSATLSFNVGENSDPDKALVESVVIKAGSEQVTLPVKQEAAEMTLLGEPAIYHTAQEEKVVYLDHKGDTIRFEVALARPYAINGQQVPDMLWTEEEAELAYHLSDDTWIKVVDVTMTIPGVYELHIATVPTPDTYNATLSLRFDWEGQTFLKEVQLQSTEVFHINVVP